MTGFTYTGIGARKTPEKFLEMMEELAREFAMLGGRLRSGGAPGADTAFARGAGREADIFLPRPGFAAESFGGTTFGTPEKWTYGVAAKAHPRWQGLDQKVKQLHARNAHQILGLDGESPADFVVCWTPDGCASGHTTAATGGTGQALRIAAAYGVPIFNLAVEGHAAAALELAWRLASSVGAGAAVEESAEGGDLMGYLSAVMADVLRVEVALAREGLQAAQDAFQPGRGRAHGARAAARLWFPTSANGTEVAMGTLSYAEKRARRFHAAQAAAVPEDLVDVVVDAIGWRVGRAAAAVGLHRVADMFDGTGFGTAAEWSARAEEAAREWGLYAGRGERSGWPVVMQATSVLRRVAAAAM